LLRYSLTILLSTFALLVAGLSPAAAGRGAAIITDAATGAVLYEYDADASRYPASLTKVMTLYLLFEALDAKRVTLDSRFPVSARAANQDPTKLGLKDGETITVREVILGLVTKSANDAAVVAAEGLAGTEPQFALQMTEKARRLGMANTIFRNASGLPDPQQKTTARDLSLLARAMIKNYPHHYHFFDTPSFTYKGITHANHNRLNNWYAGADGLKTGYIRASGFNLVTSAKRDNRRLIGVVMGGISPGARDQEMARLLDAAFARKAGQAGAARRGEAGPRRSAYREVGAHRGCAHRACARGSERRQIGDRLGYPGRRLRADRHRPQSDRAGDEACPDLPVGRDGRPDAAQHQEGPDVSRPSDRPV
jgi:D-alanyl-D-alanine carboxypeptidase